MTASDDEKDLISIAKEMLEQGELTEADFDQIKGIDHVADLGEDQVIDPVIDQAVDEKSADLRSMLRDMGIPKKVKLAMFGNATCRMLLVLDSNRLVQEAVLKNPQIQEREVIDFARNANISENVIRKIATSKVWMKNYAAKVNIVSNPKTPSDLSVKWLKHLRQAELKKLASSKNVSQIVSTTAKKMLVALNK